MDRKEAVRAYLCSRDGQPMVNNLGVRLRVIRYSWMAVGGPDACWLEARGSDAALLELPDLLRCPLEAQRTDGTPVWWGFVDGVWMKRGNLDLGLTLDEVANRVRASYRPVLPSAEYVGRRVKTPWLDASDSQNVYGIKEAQVRLDEAAPGAAQSRAAVTLAERRYPLPALSPDPGTAEPPGSAAARIRARGWWHTTGWRIYDQPCGLEQTDLPGGGGIVVGTPASQHIRQTIETAGVAAWPADRLWARVYRHGAPVDGLAATLHDGAGSLLGQTPPIPASSMPVGGGWLAFFLSAPVIVSPGMRIDIRFARDGSLDPANYYRLGTTGLMARENLSFWDGGSYRPCDPPGTLLFKLAGSEDSALQMARMLAGDCGGQFFGGWDLPVSSGIAGMLWREGDRSAREEVEALLRTGSGGGRRYQAEVDSSRRVIVYTEPEPGAADWGIWSDGHVTDATGARVPPGACPVGMWVKAMDLPPVIASGQQMADPTRFMVERAEWNVEDGKLRLFPRGEALTR